MEVSGAGVSSCMHACTRYAIIINANHRWKQNTRNLCKRKPYPRGRGQVISSSSHVPYPRSLHSFFFFFFSFSLNAHTLQDAISTFLNDSPCCPSPLRIGYPKTPRIKSPRHIPEFITNASRARISTVSKFPGIYLQPTRFPRPHRALEYSRGGRRADRRDPILQGRCREGGNVTPCSVRLK